MGGKLKVGIIGAGRLGKVVIGNIVRDIKEVEVKTVADVDIENKRNWLEELGIKNCVNDYKEILKDNEINAVLILSSTNTHSRLIIESAEAGKDIFCEKPIDLNINKIKEALKAVDRAGVRLQVGFVRRFDHNFKKIKETISQGKIGEPQIIKITSRDPDMNPDFDYYKTSGHIFLDCTIHDFDMMRFLSGSEVTEVHAFGSVLVDKRYEELDDVDTSIVSLKFESGAIGVIDNSRKTGYGYDQRVEVFGSKGCVAAENDNPTSINITTEDGVIKDKPKWFLFERYNNAFIDEFKDFFNTIINDTEVSVGGIDGLIPVQIAVAAKESLDTGRAVKIEPIKNE